MTKSTGPKNITTKQMVKAIEGTGGIKTMIAKRLGVNRNMIDYYLKKYATVRKAYDQETETIGDIAETTILKDIQEGSVETAKWYARVKLTGRGYAEKQQIETSGKIEVDLIGSWEDLMNGKDT